MECTVVALRLIAVLIDFIFIIIVATVVKTLLHISFSFSLAGMSRSVTVAVAYIMSVTTLNWREALKVVRAGRAVANPNLGFQRQLQEFETYKLVEVSDASIGISSANAFNI